MPVFQYEALTETGRTRKGVLEGNSPQHVRDQLRGMGFTPLAVGEETEKKSSSSGSFFSFLSKRKKISTTTLSLFTYQLGTLLSAGLPIEVALMNIAEQMDASYFKTVLLGVHQKVMEGNSLGKSMDDFPDVFPKLYRATITAGEKSGKMDLIVDRLASFMDAQEGIKQKIKHATIYPGLLTLVSLAIVTFLLTYAMPKITAVFQETGQALPDITLFLLSLSAAIKTYGLYVLAIIIVGVIIFKRMLRSYSFKFRVHQFLLKVPVIKNAIVVINGARFLRTFGILFGAGVPVLDAMNSANSVVTLLPMQEAIKDAVKQVGEGKSISQTLFLTGYFTKLTTQLIASGEAIGKMELMLEKTAAYQEQNMMRWITTALALFEPAMILTMGMIVLFIVMAILLPIFDMNQFFK